MPPVGRGAAPHAAARRHALGAPIRRGRTRRRRPRAPGGAAAPRRGGVGPAAALRGGRRRPRALGGRPGAVGRRAGDGLDLRLLIFEDVTERSRRERGERFLAEGSKMLAGSLDYEATLRTI